MSLFKSKMLNLYFFSLIYIYTWVYIDFIKIWQMKTITLLLLGFLAIIVWNSTGNELNVKLNHLWSLWNVTMKKMFTIHWHKWLIFDIYSPLHFEHEWASNRLNHLVCKHSTLFSDSGKVPNSYNETYYWLMFYGRRYVLCCKWWRTLNW